MEDPLRKDNLLGQSQSEISPEAIPEQDISVETGIKREDELSFQLADRGFHDINNALSIPIGFLEILKGSVNRSGLPVDRAAFESIGSDLSQVLLSMTSACKEGLSLIREYRANPTDKKEKFTLSLEEKISSLNSLIRELSLHAARLKSWRSDIRKDEGEGRELGNWSVYIEKIERQVDFISSISQEINGEFVGEKTLINLSSWLLRYMPILEKYGEDKEKKIDFHFQVGKNEKEVHIRLDYLSRILQNLLVNARQALALKGSRIEFSCHENSEGDHFILEIGDDGSGMSEEVRSKIFDPFFTTKKEGSGLGLSIVKELVEESGGRIEVESELGVGTKFKIYLPVVKE